MINLDKIIEKMLNEVRNERLKHFLERLEKEKEVKLRDIDIFNLHKILKKASDEYERLKIYESFRSYVNIDIREFLKDSINKFINDKVFKVSQHVIPLKMFIKCSFMSITALKVIPELKEFKDKLKILTPHEIITQIRGNAMHKIITNWFLNNHKPYFIEDELKHKHKDYILIAKPDLIFVREYLNDKNRSVKFEVPIEFKFVNPPKTFDNYKTIQDILQAGTYAELMHKSYGYLMYISDQDVKVFLVSSAVGREVLKRFEEWVDSDRKKLTIKTIYCTECYFKNYCEYVSKYEDRLIHPEIRSEHVLDFDDVLDKVNRLDMLKSMQEYIKKIYAMVLYLFGEEITQKEV